MPRKSTGSSIRNKKTAASLEPIAHPATVESAQEGVRKNVTVSAAPASKNGGANIDEEIRYRAYELYLQRNGAAGDPNADWFVAEREVRARHATAGHSA